MYNLAPYRFNSERELTYPDLSPKEIGNRETILGQKRSVDTVLPRNTTFTPLVPKFLADAPLKEDTPLADMHFWIEKEPKGLFYPISPRLKKILCKYNLPPHQIYDAKIMFNDCVYEYSVIQFITKHFEQLIDFKKSTFCNWDAYEQIKLSNQHFKASGMDELYGICDEKDWDEWGFNKAVMKKEFAELDLCSLQSWNIVISERLKNAIEEAGLKGIKITKYPIEFEISDE